MTRLVDNRAADEPGAPSGSPSAAPPTQQGKEWISRAAGANNSTG